MVSVMNLQFVAVPFWIILAILRNRKFKEEEKEKEYEEEHVNENNIEINEKGELKDV